MPNYWVGNCSARPGGRCSAPFRQTICSTSVAGRAPQSSRIESLTAVGRRIELIRDSHRIWTQTHISCGRVVAERFRNFPAAKTSGWQGSNSTPTEYSIRRPSVSFLCCNQILQTIYGYDQPGTELQQHVLSFAESFRERDKRERIHR